MSTGHSRMYLLTGSWEFQALEEYGEDFANHHCNTCDILRKVLMTKILLDHADLPTKTPWANEDSDLDSLTVSIKNLSMMGQSSVKKQLSNPSPSQVNQVVSVKSRVCIKDYLGARKQSLKRFPCNTNPDNRGKRDNVKSRLGKVRRWSRRGYADESHILRAQRGKSIDRFLQNRLFLWSMLFFHLDFCVACVSTNILSYFVIIIQ